MTAKTIDSYNPIKEVLAQLSKYSVLLLFAVAALFPFILMWSSALRTSKEIFRNPFALPSVIHFENLIDAWTVGRFSSYMLNSVITTIPTVICVVALSCLAGYGLAHFQFKGRNLVLYVFLLGIMVPFQSVMVPLYYQLRDYHLLGTY